MRDQERFCRVRKIEGCGVKEYQHRLSDGSPKGIPRPLVKPVEELEEAVLGQVCGGAVVEVWVILVDHALVPYDRE